MGLLKFERAILQAVDVKGDESDMVMIWEQLESVSFKRLSAGALYTVLSKLEVEGLVTSRQGEATAARGWRPKRYFKITDAGREALKAKETTQ